MNSARAFFIMLATFWGANALSIQEIDPEVSLPIRRAVYSLVEIVTKTAPSDIPAEIEQSESISRFINGPGRSRLIPKKIVIDKKQIFEIEQQVATAHAFLMEDRSSLGSNDSFYVPRMVESTNSYLFVLPILTKKRRRSGPATFSADTSYTRIPGEVWVKQEGGKKILLDHYPLQDQTRAIFDNLRRWITFEEMFHMLELRASYDQNLTFNAPVNKLLKRTGLPANFSAKNPFYRKWVMEKSIYYDHIKQDKAIESVAPGVSASDLSYMAELTVYLIGQHLLSELFEDEQFHEMIVHNHASARHPESKLYKIMNANRASELSCSDLALGHP